MGVCHMSGRLSYGRWLAAVAALALPALAEPVLDGAAPAGVTVNPGQNTVVNVTQNKAIINWQSFNVSSSESVQFIQPSATAAVLNRITNNLPTMIDGTVTANGRLYFVNPAGVVFGPNASVSAAALYAAAGQLSDANFAAGLDHFTGIAGNVTNQGSINADVLVALVGRKVGNMGSVVVPGGMIAMVAGNDVLLRQFEGRLIAEIQGGAALPSTEAAIDNAGIARTYDAEQSPSGSILMAAADVYALAVHNSGTVRAASTDVRGSRVVTTGGGVFEGEDLDVTTSTGATLGTAVDRLYVSNGGAGDVYISEEDDVELRLIIVSNGNTAIDTGGNLTVGSVLVPQGSAVLSADGDIDVQIGVVADAISMFTPGTLYIASDAELNTSGAGGPIVLSSSDFVIYGGGGNNVFALGEGPMSFGPVIDAGEGIVELVASGEGPVGLGVQDSYGQMRSSGSSYGWFDYNLSNAEINAIHATHLIIVSDGEQPIVIGYINPQNIQSLSLFSGAEIAQEFPGSSAVNIDMPGGSLAMYADGPIGERNRPIVLDIDQLTAITDEPGTVDLYALFDMEVLYLYTFSGDIQVSAGGNLILHMVTANSHIDAAAGGNMQIDTLRASENVTLTARSGNLTALRNGSPSQPHIDAGQKVTMSAGQIGTPQRPIHWKGQSVSTTGLAYIQPTGSSSTGGGGNQGIASSSTTVSREASNSSNANISDEERRRPGEGRDGLNALWAVGEFLETLGWLESHPQLVDVDRRWGQVLASYIETGLQERGKRTVGVGPTVSADQTEALLEQGLQYQIDGVIESLEAYVENGEPMARVTVVYELKKNVSKQLRIVQKMRLRTANNSQPEVTEQDLETLLDMTAGRIVDNVVNETPAGMMGIRG